MTTDIPEYEFPLPRYSRKHPEYMVYIQERRSRQDEIASRINTIINHAVFVIDEELDEYQRSGRAKQSEPRLKADPRHYSRIGTQNYGIVTHERVSYAITKDPSLVTQIPKEYLSHDHLIFVASRGSHIRCIPKDLITDEHCMASLIGGNQMKLTHPSTSEELWFMQQQLSPDALHKIPPLYRTQEACYRAFGEMYFGPNELKFIPKDIRSSETFRQLVCRDFPIKAYSMLNALQEGGSAAAIRDFGTFLSWTSWKCIVLQFNPVHAEHLEGTLRNLSTTHLTDEQINALIAIAAPLRNNLPRNREREVRIPDRERNHPQVNYLAARHQALPFKDDAADRVARDVSKISVPYDPGPIPTFPPPNGRILENGITDSGMKISCCICITELQHPWNGVVIECGGHPNPDNVMTPFHHYYCGVCIVDMIRVQTDIHAPDFDVSAWKKVSGIACCTFDGASPIPFPPRLILSVLNDRQYERYLKSRETFVIRHAEELSAFRALSEAKRTLSDPVPRHISYIQDYILTTRCPKASCRAPFDGFDGCAALTCRSCSIVFCAYCHTANALGSVVHTHVRSCALNPSCGTFGGSLGILNDSMGGTLELQDLEGVKLGKHRRVTAYLQSIEPTSIRPDIIPTIVDDYHGNKMNPEWVNEITKLMEC